MKLQWRQTYRPILLPFPTWWRKWRQCPSLLYVNDVDQAWFTSKCYGLVLNVNQHQHVQWQYFFACVLRMDRRFCCWLIILINMFYIFYPLWASFPSQCRASSSSSWTCEKEGELIPGLIDYASLSLNFKLTGMSQTGVRLSHPSTDLVPSASSPRQTREAVTSVTQPQTLHQTPCIVLNANHQDALSPLLFHIQLEN